MNQYDNKSLNQDVIGQQPRESDARPADTYEYKSSFAKRYFDEQKRNGSVQNRDLLQGLDYLIKSKQQDQYKERHGLQQ